MAISYVTANLQNILAQQSLNAKPFWNIARNPERNNNEYLFAFKGDKGNREFSQEEIKLHTINYYKSYTTVDKFHK